MRDCNKTYRSVVAFLLVLCTFVLLCPQSYATTDNNSVSISLVGKYDSADLAAIRSVDSENRTITFRNHATGRSYTLSYDNTSMMYSQRGTAISARLLEQGQVVKVFFLKSTKHITSLTVSADAWTIDSTRDHNLVRGDGTAKIKGDIYKIDNKTLVIAEDKLALAEDILSTDSIKVSGVGRDIYSVIVTSGHGYVSLSSDTVEDQSLVGAWIELDNDVIYKISPNMLLSAPEGDYTLQILGNGANYQSEVTINRNQETVVDTSNVTISKPKEGLVTFKITPENAEVFVDGQKVLTDTPQSIVYGYHNLKIIADGYITQTKYLKVGTPKSVIEIELEKDKDASATSSSDSASGNSSKSDKSNEKASLAVNRADAASVSSSSSKKKETSSNSSQTETGENVVISGYYIYFDAPYAAELYFDGSYIGMIPTHVPKISGNHEIILKKDGYETKSYRILVDTDKDNVKYEFPDLVKIQSSSDSGSSDSATNASSGKSDSSDAASSASSEDGSSSTSAVSASTAPSEKPDEDASTQKTTSDDGGQAKTKETTPDTGNNTDNTDNSGNAKTEAPKDNSGGNDAANTASGEG